MIAAGMLPWTILVPFLPWRSLKPSPARLYCAIAAGTIVTLFSLAKLIPYVMPAFPPFAVIVADAALALDGAAQPDIAKCHGTHRPRRHAICGAILAITGTFTVVLAPEAARFGTPYLVTMHAVLLAAGIVLIAGGSLCAVVFWRGNAAAGLVSIVATAAAIIVIASYGRILARAGEIAGPTRARNLAERTRRTFGLLFAIHPVAAIL